jgi:hypothetical protein
MIRGMCELEKTDLGSGIGMHTPVHSHFYGFWSTVLGFHDTLGGHELAPV